MKYWREMLDELETDERGYVHVTKKTLMKTIDGIVKVEKLTLLEKAEGKLQIRISNRDPLSEKFWRNGGNKPLQRTLNQQFHRILLALQLKQ